MTTLPTQTSSPNPLRGARLSFVGVGVMAEAMIAGLLRRQLVTRGQIVGSHPRPARREELQTHYGIRMVESNRDAAARDAATHDASRTDATPTKESRAPRKGLAEEVCGGSVVIRQSYSRERPFVHPRG